MALSCSSNDTRNFQSVTVASVDVIKLPLRDILDRHIKPGDLYHKITSCSTLNLRPEQKTICLVPPPDLPDYNKFDVTLLYTLIRNLCPLPRPKRGWGGKPEALDIQISDDIERLRLFRNNYYAHANSTAISDHMFKNIWRDLKQTFTRIESKYKLDYKDELLRIEQLKYTHSHWEECMLILDAYASRQKETDETPDIIIHGENEIICGGTAQFEADVKKVESSCWSVAWQKQRGDVIERINTRMERYSGSTQKKLVIKTVCKEDEGEYQAVLSLESNGPYYTSRNTIRLHVLGGLPNITTSLETNVKTRSVKLTAIIYFYDDSPGIFETFWTKNDKKINPEESGKVLSEMTTHNRSLTIRNVGPDDAGEYQLTAINDVGSSTSDVIILGIPSVFAKNIEENDEGLRITVTIKSLPPPCHVQWSAKRKDDENFTPIDINTEEYKGTTISFPHPVLVVRQKDQLEKNCFQIKVTNFIGKTVQEISGNDNPAVSKNTDTVRNTVYSDLNASVRFMKLNNILAEQFPCQKVETLKFLLTSSNKVKLKNSVLDAESAMDCLKILQDEKLFTPTDVIFMQFLCRETGCLELYEKCKDYAEKQEALCFFEKRSVNGYVDVQFHVQGDLSRYTKEYLQDVIKTVAAIVDCKEEDILLKSIEHSESFLLSLALKDVYILKMFALKEQDHLKLRKLNIDFFIIHEETIHLEKAKGVGEREKRIVTRSSYDTKMVETHQISMQEAIAIVLDVGPSMNNAPPGEETPLQTAVDAIKMIIQRKMFSESKDEVSLVLFGTPDTDNPLADGDSYENVTISRPLGVVDFDFLQQVQNDITPSNTSADFVDALVVALDHLVNATQGKKGFAMKRLILLSDLGGEFGDDQIEAIISGIKNSGTELNVIGPDINLDGDEDDDDSQRPGPSGAANGHQKARTPQQKAGEGMLKRILEEVEGECYSFSEALPALSHFQMRQVRPTPWKVQLEITSNIRIPVCSYIKIKDFKVKSFKKVYAKDEDAEIDNLRTYHKNDEEETEVDKEDIVEGHRYGTTLVPMSEDDKLNMKYKAEKCLKALGFTDAQNIKRHHFMGDNTHYVVADKDDETAVVALSALINALYETNMAVVVRKVYSAATAPKLGCLLPHIKSSYECLIYVELPFREDIRQYTFGSLPLKQDTEANKKYRPTDAQLDAINDLINESDLSQAAEDEDGEKTEALKPKLIFNPYFQRLYQCLQHRALEPHEPLPELSPMIANSLNPPQEVSARCEAQCEKLKNLFKLEKVKKEDRKTGENMFKQKEEDEPSAKKIKMDDDLGGGLADITKAEVTEVGTVTPVDDFISLINQKDADKFEEASGQMQKRVEHLVTDSFGPQFYGKALDCLKALRQQSIKKSEPTLYNNFMKKFKDFLIEKGRRDFWEMIVDDKQALITKTESEDSSVSLGEAKDFIAEKVEAVKAESQPPAAGDDAEDLLDQI